MEIAVYNHYQEMSEAAAQLVLDLVTKQPGALICFPSGESPTGLFKLLVKYAAEGKVDFSKCYFVGLDEWIGMDETNEGSCKHFMYSHFFNKINIPDDHIIFFDAQATDIDQECERINKFVRDSGGLDLMIVGIGMNGHIGLNEPGTDFDTYAHRSTLDKVTMKVGQKYFKQETELKEGITLGLRHFKEAKIPVLIASGNKKAAIVAKALQGEVSTGVPASILQNIPDSVILLDKEAAVELKASLAIKTV